MAIAVFTPLFEWLKTSTDPLLKPLRDRAKKAPYYAKSYEKAQLEALLKDAFAKNVQQHFSIEVSKNLLSGLQQLATQQKNEVALKTLNAILAKDPLSKDEMGHFLHQLSQDQDKKALFSALVDGFYEDTRHNMSNFARFMEEWDGACSKSLEIQANHAEYLQAWEKVGLRLGQMLSKAMNTALDLCLYGQLPLSPSEDEPNQATNPKIVPIKA